MVGHNFQKQRFTAAVELRKILRIQLMIQDDQLILVIHESLDQLVFAFKF